ncbi:Hypothetical predicted protein [Cloeon dipterum]|uniref:Uncharacterized protein n=1 Tax=Cloeon dipterum TaxID=197152 RepID=A0A8S1D7T0_9INSE|nr:Hypothetical predicted protein [Cloeon dipterum]
MQILSVIPWQSPDCEASRAAEPLTPCFLLDFERRRTKMKRNAPSSNSPMKKSQSKKFKASPKKKNFISDIPGTKKNGKPHAPDPISPHRSPAKKSKPDSAVPAGQAILERVIESTVDECFRSAEDNDDNELQYVSSVFIGVMKRIEIRHQTDTNVDKLNHILNELRLLSGLVSTWRTRIDNMIYMKRIDEPDASSHSNAGPSNRKTLSPSSTQAWRIKGPDRSFLRKKKLTFGSSSSSPSPSPSDKDESSEPEAELEALPSGSRKKARSSSLLSHPGRNLMLPKTFQQFKNCLSLNKRPARPRNAFGGVRVFT